eukprot:COSAG01_NODE_20302_length_960_cov_8.631823_2_plen_75_part_00
MGAALQKMRVDQSRSDPSCCTLARAGAVPQRAIPGAVARLGALVVGACRSHARPDQGGTVPLAHGRAVPPVTAQ